MESYWLLFGSLCLVFLWINLWASIRIIAYLKSRGEEASLFKKGFFIKGRIFRYLGRYKSLTTQEYGRAGKWLPVFYLSFTFVLTCLALGIFC